MDATAGRPLRVLHLAPGGWPRIGGGQLLSTRLAEGLALRGHAVHMVDAAHGSMAWTGRAREPESGAPARPPGLVVESPPGWDRLQRWEERLRRWPVPGRSNLRKALHRRQGPLLAQHLVQLLRRERADVLLVSGVGRLLVQAAQAARAEVPVALLAVPMAHFEDPGFGWDEALPFWRSADALAANTPYEADELARRTGLPREACVVTGVGSEAPAAAAPWPRPPVIVFLGRIVPGKGIDLLLEALQQPPLQQAFAAQPEARLVVAGARTGLSAPIEAAIAALPPALRARVDSPRDLPEAAKHDLLARARVLVLPSRMESFGIVLLEAWVQGTPVVTLDTPVGRAVVTHGHDGLCVPPSDPAALSAALAQLLADPSLAQRLGTAGRTTSLTHHTWPLVAERYEHACRMAKARHAGCMAVGTCREADGPRPHGGDRGSRG